MKIFITSILCIIQSVYTFTSINYNKPFKYNNILLNTATYANINKKKWNPPIGYIPESLKNKKKNGILLSDMFLNHLKIKKLLTKLIITFLK